MNQRGSLPVLTENARPYSNTPLGRSGSNNSSSLSSHLRVFLSSSCSNLISPYHLSLKQIKPGPWQRLFEGKIQPDSLMKKNQSNNEDFIAVLNENSEFEENSRAHFLPAPIQTHIDQLYEQIDDLVLQLSDERMRHKQTRIKAAEKVLTQWKDQERRFDELFQQTLLDHQNQLNEQEKKFFNILNDEQIQAYQREQQIKSELRFVKKSFVTYKSTLENNHNKPLQTKEEEEINRRINDALLKERKLSNEKQQIEMENIRKQYRNEIATMQKSSTDATVDKEQVESLKQELTSTILELNQTKEHAKNLSTRLKDLHNQHTKTIRELNDCRMRFDDQAKKIEKLYTGRVGQLN